MSIIFRVDASTQIGSGHVMRCLTLAESLNAKGIPVSFISRKLNGDLNYLISKKGFHVIELKEPETKKVIKSVSQKNIEDYSQWLGVSEMQDVQDTIFSLKHKKPDWLIIDHYSIGENWENELRPYVKNIMAIDDLANRRHNCDVLLDQNWFENLKTRYDDLVPVSCIKLLGPKYVLMQPKFAELRKSKKSQKKGKIER